MSSWKPDDAATANCQRAMTAASPVLNAVIAAAIAKARKWSAGILDFAIRILGSAALSAAAIAPSLPVLACSASVESD